MLHIREATIRDLPEMLDIYNHAVLTTTGTFDLLPQTMEQRLEWFSHYDEQHPLLVAEDEGRVIGYACISRYRPKPAYAPTVESSVYIVADRHGEGVGTALMTELISRARGLGYHSILAGITGGNEASARLHMKLGFQQVACLKEVGFKFGAWHDTRFFQLML